MTDDITALRQAQYLVFPSGPVMRVLDALEASQAECARLRAAINVVVREPHAATVGIVALHIINSEVPAAALATKETK